MITETVKIITMIIIRNEKIGDTKAALQALMEQIPEPGGRALLLQTVINVVINTVIKFVIVIIINIIIVVFAEFFLQYWCLVLISNKAKYDSLSLSEPIYYILYDKFDEIDQRA